MAKKNEEVKTQDIKLSEEEKTAVEVQKTVAKGQKSKDQYKLKDPNTSYSEKDFTLSGDQKKELPDNPSPELVARIRSGFIVKA